MGFRANLDSIASGLPVCTLHWLHSASSIVSLYLYLLSRIYFSFVRTVVSARKNTRVLTMSRSALGPTHNGYRVFSPGVNRPGRGFDHPPHLALRLKRG